MSNETNIKEIIAELDKIDNLCAQLVDIDKKMDDVIPQHKEELEATNEKVCERLTKYQDTQEEKLTGIVSKLTIKYTKAPPKNTFNPRNPLSPNLTILLGAASLLLIYFTIIFWIVAFTISSGTLALPAVILTALTVFMNVYFPIFRATIYLKRYKAINYNKELTKEWEKEFNEYFSKKPNEQRYATFREYDKQFLAMVDLCDKKYEEENEKYKAEIEKIGEKYRNMIEALGKEKSIVVDDLNSTTLIPEDLFAYSWRISSMLKQKRADTLKEAINLALDEKRKEDEEETRREEAARREYILKQQALDNRLHNMAMEEAAREEARATKEHNEAMERAAQAQASAAQAHAAAAQAQAKEAEKQTKIAEQQARDMENAARERCARCTNTKCSIKFSKAAIGCPSFNPRR